MCVVPSCGFVYHYPGVAPIIITRKFCHGKTAKRALLQAQESFPWQKELGSIDSLGHLAPMKDINEIPEGADATASIGGERGICTILHRSLSKRILSSYGSIRSRSQSYDSPCLDSGGIMAT